MNPEGVLLILCECGPLLKETLDMDALAARCAGMGEVARIRRHPALCSEDGRRWMKEELLRDPGRRVVIAGCSPREHEKTFMDVFREAGLNPYCFAMANLREQCAWMIPEVAAATRKAETLVRAAAARALRLRPLQEEEIDCCGDVLVIGAGVAGLTAALLAAKGGRKVTLVEKAPCVGGTAALIGEVFPDMECASCMMEPLVDEVLHHRSIEVLTLSRVEEVLGYMGNFTVLIRKEARHVNEGGCLGCGLCHEPCPVTVKNEDFDFGLSERKAVYIAFPTALPHVSCIDESACLNFQGQACDACALACPLGNITLGEQPQKLRRHVGAVILATGVRERRVVRASSAMAVPNVVSAMAFERILHPDGPRKGEILDAAGRQPSSIAFIHGMDPDGQGNANPCSRVLCEALGKLAALAGKHLPGACIHEIAREGCAVAPCRPPAADEAIGRRTLSPGDTVRLEPGAAPGDPIGIVMLRNGRTERIAADMVVIGFPLEGSAGAEALAGLLRIETDPSGFFKPAHAKLSTFQSRMEGVFLAGSAQGPKDIRDTASHGAAAAGAALSLLVPGRRLRMEAAVSHVLDHCSGCGLCLMVCPFGALTMEASSKRAEINGLLCRGCGSCAALCPAAAIEARHATDDQIIAEVAALCDNIHQTQD